MISSEANSALVLLAQRKLNDDDFAFWHSYEFNFFGPSTFECFLCGAKYHNLPSIDDHGIQHLKEYNLLPFI